MKRHRLVALLCLCLQGSLNAAPAISSCTGTLGQGNSVTLGGSAFGTKTTAAPLKFDNFEGGSNGSSLSGWTLEGSPPPSYSTTVKRTNSTLSARANFTGGNFGSNFELTGQSFHQVFFDTWYYLDTVSPHSRNHKLFRILTDDFEPNLYYNIYCPALTAGGHFTQDGVDVGNYHAFTGPGPDSLAGVWTHMQVYLKESSTSAHDGTAMMWMDSDPQLEEEGNFRTRTTNETWSQLHFGNYLGHDAVAPCGSYGDAFTYWDDTYVDTTRSHVEIGSANTFNNSDHREIQIPTAWSTSSVSVNLNKGAYASFTGLYLYVVDSNGLVNASGYAVSGCSGGGGGGTISRYRRLRLKAGLEGSAFLLACAVAGMLLRKRKDF